MSVALALALATIRMATLHTPHFTFHTPRSTFHSTPLALWRGVVGEAFPCLQFAKIKVFVVKLGKAKKKFEFN